MFRAQQNAFDDLVVKATDENLTSENWELILDVCDRVGSQDSGGKDAVAAMIKRLAHRNANVQLYTLELANALSQNCGAKIHRELASRSFTDALLRLAQDRNTHQQVRAKIAERMLEWTDMFRADADLGVMEQAYGQLKSRNPNLHPPSKPVKMEISDEDRRREEQELQMALALSIKDKADTPKGKEQGQQEQQQQQQQQQQQESDGAAGSSGNASHPQGTTAATVSRVRALFDFTPSEPGELQFRKGDIIAVLESVYKDWWKGSLRGSTGIFPLNYVEKLQDPTKEELEREAAMEQEVFEQMGNVEKLLALLSTSSREVGDVGENEEISKLYHSTLAIRPKLIELISKYSQKKDDFTQLNEKFIKARRDYENLLEASMSHPPPVSYGRPPYQQGPPQEYGNFGYSAPLPQQHQHQQQQQHQQSIPPPQQQYNSYAPQEAPQQQHYDAPPQQEQRLYSPPPDRQPGGAPQFPAQNGPAPFYMIPPGQQSQMQINQRASPTPSSQAQRLASGVPAGPHSMAFPPGSGPHHAPPGPGGGPPLQELATGGIDSPIDHRNNFQPPPPQQAPPQAYPPQQTPQQPAYTTDSPSSAYSQQPQFPPQQQQQQPGHPVPAQSRVRDSYVELPQHRYSLYSNAPGQAQPPQQQQQPSQPPPDDDIPSGQGGGGYPAFGKPPGMPGGPPPPTGYPGYSGPPGGAVSAGGDEEGYYR